MPLNAHDAVMLTRKHAVFAAAAMYGLFSSPTPDAPGMTEYLIVALIGFAGLPMRLPREKWVLPYTVFILYGLTVPFIMGAFAGHEGGGILRDAVAFSALALPLLLTQLYPAGDRTAQRMLLLMLLGIGVLFSIRYLLSVATPAGFLRDHDLLYLANSPLVAFAGAWMLLQGSFTETRPGRAALMCLLSVIPVLAMIAMTQRATVMLLACAWLAGFAVCVVRNPRRALVLGLVLVITGILLAPWPGYVAQSFADKTMAVGWNARGAELGALMNASMGNPLTAIFGSGWGSMLKSPAVGDLWVRFSHALFTSLLWKTGWVGFILSIAAMGALVAAAFRRLRHDMVTFTALILPLLPALFLYGSYKSLCFGLLLLGFAALQWTKPAQG